MNDNQSSEERRRNLTARTAQEEQRISELNTELERRRAFVKRLKDGTDRAQVPNDAASSMPIPLAREAKVRLFRTLFRGREDGSSRRWESRKTGKSGYSPACANEWDSLLCAKKRGSVTARTASCIRSLSMKLAGFLRRTLMLERGRRIPHRSSKPAVHTTSQSRSSDRVPEMVLTPGSFSPSLFHPASPGIWGVS